MGNFLVRYAPTVVIYDHRAVIRLATADGIKSSPNLSFIVALLLSFKQNGVARYFERGKAKKYTPPPCPIFGLRAV